MTSQPLVATTEGSLQPPTKNEQIINKNNQQQTKQVANRPKTNHTTNKQTNKQTTWSRTVKMRPPRCPPLDAAAPRQELPLHSHEVSRGSWPKGKPMFLSSTWGLIDLPFGSRHGKLVPCGLHIMPCSPGFPSTGDPMFMRPRSLPTLRGVARKRPPKFSHVSHGPNPT